MANQLWEVPKLSQQKVLLSRIVTRCIFIIVRFDAERYKEEGGVAACVDVDECLSQEEGDGEERLCEQVMSP